ncbi:MAG: hypothetical protein QNI99_09430 [Woeseiaceae bacterium]|nr:hypothetical protein [Woeseiaceae bacterium]
MEAVHTPLILYIPGLLPKPKPEAHHDALFRCLEAGVRQIDESIADDIVGTPHSFDLVSWTYDFYREHRDFAIDRQAIEDVIAHPVASPGDRREAGSWTRRATLALHRLGDLMPFLIPYMASEKTEVHIRDLSRYLRNRNGIADHIREMLKLPLRAATEAHRPILLLAHSMGSIISWDSLWEMTHVHGDHVVLDTLVSMGSPLGQNYLMKRIKGNDREGAERYPHNVERWLNISAVGDMTAVDPKLANDYAGMTKLGLVESIVDLEMYNAFHLDGVLNTHAEYGYLANEVTGRVVAEWWQRVRRPD